MGQQMLQPRRLIDAHTAGMLPRASVDFDSRFYSSFYKEYGAGLNAGIAVGITDRLMIGLGYGGEGLIGRSRDVRWNYFPGVLFKYRLFEESFGGPGVALGYDHQGYGGLTDTSQFDYNGYIYPSPGFFLALSKNFRFLNHVLFGVHGTLNYSIETVKLAKWPNVFTGIDISINEELALVAEYNFGLNVRDNQPEQADRYARITEGYLNCGLRWAFSPQFFIEVDVKDVTENRFTKYADQVGWSRELKLVYFFSFLKE
jgi:hypothetical protein